MAQFSSKYELEESFEVFLEDKSIVSLARLWVCLYEICPTRYEPAGNAVAYLFAKELLKETNPSKQE